MGLLMAEKQRPAERPADEEDEPTTSAQLFKADVRKLTQLKALRGEKSIAVTFRAKLRKILATELARALEKAAEDEAEG